MRISDRLLDQAAQLRHATTALDARARAERGGELNLTLVAVLGRVLTQGPITPRELGHQLRMLPQSLTRPIAALERLGHLHRTPDPADGRGALLEATGSGREAIRTEMAPRTRWLAETIAVVCDEDDVRTLVRAAAIMQRLVAHDDVTGREA